MNVTLAAALALVALVGALLVGARWRSPAPPALHVEERAEMPQPGPPPGRRPVLVRGAFADWPAVQRWSVPTLARCISPVDAKASDEPVFQVGHNEPASNACSLLFCKFLLLLDIY